MASKLPLTLPRGALTCLSQLFRVSNSVIAPELMRDLHLDARQFGWAGSAFFLALFAVQLPVGLWFDRFGARRTVTVVSLLSAVGSVWIACATDASDLIAGRIVVGLGCAASFMSVVFLCARWFDSARLATALSWVFAASNIGTLAGATPLAWVAATTGWRSGFFGLAVVSIIVTILFYVVVRDRPPGSPLPATHREPLGEVFRGLWAVWRTKGLLPLLSMHFFAYATMLTILGIWGGHYLFDVHGLDGVQRGNVLLAMGVAQTLGILAYGPMDRVLGSRKKVVFGGALISAVFLGALALIAALLIIGIGIEQIVSDVLQHQLQLCAGHTAATSSRIGDGGLVVDIFQPRSPCPGSKLSAGGSQATERFPHLRSAMKALGR